MINSSILRKLLVSLIILISIQGFAQLSKTHYIPPLTSAEFGNANPDSQYIYLSTPNNGNVPYTIIPVGQPAANYITGAVSNATPVQVLVGTGVGQLFMPSSQTSTVTNNKGYIIEADAPIYVSVRMNAGTSAQAGALVSKGLSALGTTFRVGSFTNANPQSNYLNFVSVMATEDNTQVNFSDLPAGLIIKNYTGATPINVTLNEGESYIVATNSFDAIINRDGLIGTLVTSNKPIVVNTGSANGSFHNGNGRDYGIDQIAGLSKIGKEYIFVKGDGNNDWENVLIVAHTNNTTISINGNTPIATINAGDYYLIEGNQFNAAGNMYVETSEDVFAYQGIGSSTEANQGMFFVPPLSCETRGNINNIANINNIGNITYNGGLSIVTRVGATVTVNNLPLTNFSTTGPSTVNGNTDYVTYKITGLTNNVSVQGDDELYVAYFNVNGAATSGSFYSGFPSAPEINFDLQFATLGNCIPNVTLDAANAQNFDSFEWFYDDGSGFKSLALNIPSIRPTVPARYKLVGIITCTGETLESVEIPVSICPDDRDNDGIIDNIDVDNDNDGILNCEESRGNVSVNLTNISTPILEFQDGAINSAIATGTYTQNNTPGNTNTFTGTALGNFSSTIPATTNGENIYNLNFTEPVNFKIEEDTSTANTGLSDEFFIVRVFPASKNITLVDPDDRLLVDSNFDGIYESGITQISGSEIRFRVNNTPTGNAPYQFLANQVRNFEFYHKSEDMVATSDLHGIISLTCFKKDNDNDGIKDEFDLDSDNDGIPDFIENQGTLVTLLGVDTDLNGLDDVYDVTQRPIDTDADGVLDFYDLDSDNDGITDLIETGELGLLSDTDLNGIVDGSTFGVNGWIDVAEIIPDSNEIGYTLNDLDNDSIFSYIDADSDGDACSDVIEAGFSDENSDNYLGNNPVTVNTNGLVNNALDGYTLPNSNYLDAAPIIITTQPEDLEVCINSTNNISLISTTFNTIQWEVSTDGTNWNTIVDNTIYSNSQTSSLRITNVPPSFNNNFYRAFLNRNGNSCGMYSNVIQLTLLALPQVNVPNTYAQCDDDSNDGQAFFNLTLDNIKTEINPNYITENLTFTYYEAQVDAENETNAITSPEAYQDALGFTPETIWIRVENSNGCHRVTPLTLEVNPSSAALSSYTPTPIYQCDDGANNRDGTAIFDLTPIKNQIETIVFNTFNVSTNFYETLMDAELETNEIVDISNHENVNHPNTQNIWVRVKSNLNNDCLGLKGFSGLLNVELVPIANPVTINRKCDVDLNDAILNYPFDVSRLEADILNGQNPLDVTITYFDSAGSPLLYNNGTPVISPIQPTFLTENQTITIRVTNNNTLDPDGACFDETTLDFIVDTQPITNPVPPQIVCDGDASDVDDDGLYPFDTSNFVATVLGTQTGMDIFFDYMDDSGNSITDSPTLPNPLLSSTQTVRAVVVNPNNSSCIAATDIEFTVNPLPDFSVEPIQTSCPSNPTFSLTLEPFEVNTNEVFDYEWRWTNLDGTITDQFISNTREIIVTIPGTYTIELTKTDGTNCSRKEEIFVDAVQSPNLDINNIEVSFPSHTNTVSIIDVSLIGPNPEDYEYALVDNDSNPTVYQDSHVFNNVKPGFYTLHVRDKGEICTPASISNIAVIGYQRFFTPNGDGFNEFWNIKGIDENTQASSIIRIYNRYGKFLKQISPSSNQGWNGTYNGDPMPTDDYWFKVFLEDGRTFKGHFTLKR